MFPGCGYIPVLIPVVPVTMPTDSVLKSGKKTEKESQHG